MSRITTGFVPGMIAGALLLATGLAIGGADRLREGDAPDVLRAQRIEIIDQLGTVQLALGQNESGGAISVRDSMGRTMMLLGVASGGGVMVIHDSNERKPCVRIAAGPEGGDVSIGRSGAFTGQLTLDTNGAGALVLRDADQREIVAAGAIGGDAGRVETFDARTGSMLATLSATRDRQGQIRTNGPDGLPRVVLTASERREGQIYTFADEGRPLIALATRIDGPAMRLFNTDGEVAITLELDEEEGGRVVVYDREGIGRGLSAQPPRPRVVPTPQSPQLDVPWRSPGERGDRPAPR